jgi:hypothetical protein
MKTKASASCIMLFLLFFASVSNASPNLSFGNALGDTRIPNALDSTTTGPVCIQATTYIGNLANWSNLPFSANFTDDAPITKVEYFTLPIYQNCNTNQSPWLIGSSSTSPNFALTLQTWIILQGYRTYQGPVYFYAKATDALGRTLISNGIIGIKSP